MEQFERLTAQQKAEMLIKELSRRRRYNKIDWYFPEEGPLRRELYVKHMEFFALGREKRERCCMAANRVGKTESMGGYETSLHLTGIYPAWWNGIRYKRPIQAWAAGDTALTVRDIIQYKLLGLPGQFGTGLIRGDHLVRTTPKRNVPDSVDEVFVRHISGGVSRIQLKSYDQGREAFQGTERDLIWLDEEPDSDIYSECLTRTATVPDGRLMATFTPLKGMGDVIMGFMPLDGELPSHKALIMAGWDDVPHLDARTKEELWGSYSPSERDARTKGIPVVGSGRIYPIPDWDELDVEPFVLPRHFRRAYGLDVGWNATVGVFGAYDADSDIIYFYDEHYLGRQEPAIHAASLKARGAWIPGAIDPASRGRSQDDGTQLIALYNDLGLNLHFADNAVEAGIHDVWERLSTGRIKFFRGKLPKTRRELQMYHRDDKGKIVKKMDHGPDAVRYFVRTGLAIAEWPPVSRLNQGRARGRSAWTV